MPKPSRDTLNSELVLLKTPCNDVFADYSFMLKFQQNRFNDYLSADHQARLDAKIKLASKYALKRYQHKTRLYILYDVDRTALVVYDQDPDILEDIADTFFYVGSKDYYEIQPTDAYTIFIFIGPVAEPVAVYDIGNRNFVEFCYAYSSENCLSKSLVRDSWINEPRRRAKVRKDRD